MKATERVVIVQLMETFRLVEAENLLKECLERSPKDDECLYMLGNLYRKRSDWQEALQWYARAMEINPESPARHAREMIIQIMDFYDKERYNV